MLVDRFSQYSDSGSSLSSNYSGMPIKRDETFSPRSIDDSPEKSNSYYEKFCFYKIVRGLKLPMLMGDKDRKFTEKEIIEISQDQMIKHKKRTGKKISARMIETIVSIYQKEFGASPIDLMKFMQIEGHIILNDYSLSKA